MTIPGLQNNFILELVKQLRVLAREQFGKDMAAYLAVEHDVLILLNPEQTFQVNLLALTDRNLPPTTSTIDISTKALLDRKLRDETAAIAGQKLIKEIAPQIDAWAVLPITENRPYDAYKKRVIL